MVYSNGKLLSLVEKGPSYSYSNHDGVKATPTAESHNWDKDGVFGKFGSN